MHKVYFKVLITLALFGIGLELEKGLITKEVWLIKYTRCLSGSVRSTSRTSNDLAGMVNPYTTVATGCLEHTNKKLLNLMKIKKLN